MLKKFAFHTIFLLLIADMLLALSGYRVIFDQKIVQPGEHYDAGQFGDLANQKQPSLVCRYWNGLKTQTSVFDHGTRGAARDTCPPYIEGQ